jgi:hypothetical protein
MSTPTPEKGHVAPYTHAAAGWGALKQVAINLVKEKVAGGKYKTLFKQNQPDGFDCPGCAWPDRQHASTFEFCENGVKAVAAEATSKRAIHGRRADAAIGLRTGTARPAYASDEVRRRHRQVCAGGLG